MSLGDRIRLALDQHCGDDSPDPISKTAFANITRVVRELLEAQGRLMALQQYVQDAHLRAVPHQLGELVNFNEDVVLPPPMRGLTNIGLMNEVTVSFDAAEGEGRVWLMDTKRDEMIPIEGIENARKLSGLLNAWAMGWDVIKAAQAVTDEGIAESGCSCCNGEAVSVGALEQQSDWTTGDVHPVPESHQAYCQLLDPEEPGADCSCKGET